MIDLTLPPPLQPGDAVAVVAPSGPVDQVAVGRAFEAIRQRGFRIKTYGDLQRRRGYLAGDDRVRAEELNQAFRDSEVAAVLPVRGGYGMARILDLIDYSALEARPKVICGFSDVTALHLAVHRFAGVATFHGPNLQDGIGRPGGLAAEIDSQYWGMLTGREADAWLVDPAHRPLRTLAPGQGEGPLVGGNLAVLCGLLGTPYEVDTERAILLLEDVGEVPYRVDRLLAQLRLAGKLDRLQGVVLGQFTDCQPADTQTSGTLDEVFEHYFTGLQVPVLADYPVGHIDRNLTIPLGLRVSLDATARQIRLTGTHHPN